MSGDATQPPWIVTQLQDLLRQRGHAWLLQGASGLGQYDLALSLATAWLCEQPTEQGACGHCGSCHAITVRTHADLCVLMPETEMLERAWPLPEKVQAELDDKKRKPSKEIRIDALRDAVDFSQRTSGGGRGKVVLIYPADRMNTVTANALLKTLEEPPGAVRFVLATENAHQLLPTIRSRCLGHAMHWPDTQAATDWLAQQQVKPEAARAWLRAAGGRPADALLLARSGREPESWNRLPRALQQGDSGPLQAWPVREVIDTLHKLCHDLLLHGQGAEPRYFDARDLPSGIPLQALSRWSRDLAGARRTAEHPFHAGLMLDALVNQAKNILNSQPAATRP